MSDTFPGIITPGHIAYQAYATALRQQAPGTTTARWAELAPHLRAAWEQAAREVMLYTSSSQKEPHHEF